MPVSELSVSTSTVVDPNRGTIVSVGAVPRANDLSFSSRSKTTPFTVNSRSFGFWMRKVTKYCCSRTPAVPIRRSDTVTDTGSAPPIIPPAQPPRPTSTRTPASHAVQRFAIRMSTHSVHETGSEDSTGPPRRRLSAGDVRTPDS
jgi:hypothetical protein